MNVELLLSRLDRVKQSGDGRWLARCPAHEDRGPSLSIRETDDGRVLVHCFAGCNTPDVLASVGLSLPDLFPERVGDFLRPERRPFPAADVLRCISFEAQVVVMAAAKLRYGEALLPQDMECLLQASTRIQAALDAAGVDHG